MNKIYHIKNTPNNDFIQQLKTLIKGGSGLTPFLGSGCSSASGIIMGQEFTDYLGYVVYRCIYKEVGEASEFRGRWDIAKQGWPDRPNQDQVLIARKWAVKIFRRICGDDIHITEDSEHRVQSYQASGATTPALLAKMLAAPAVPPFLRSPNLLDDGDDILSIRNSLGKGLIDQRFYLQSSDSPTSYSAICEKALRSMCDWRATLQFLASLRYSREFDLLSIEEPRQCVIDSFNVHITRNRKPNLTHMMIAQLSMSARIRVALTTNFDSLLEAAFTSFGRHLAVIPVGLNDNLPHPDLIHESDCVVKLHGDCHETRADFTLDKEPSPEDKRHFFHYVRGRFPAFDLPAGSVEEAFIPSQMLVIGYSGSDNRCNEMLKYVLDSDKEATLYWICHSQTDLERLNFRFREEDYGGGRIVATVSERPDLLLYDFYQKLNLTLPSAGLTYQFPDRVLPAKDPGKKSGHPSVEMLEGEALAKKLSQRGKDAINSERGNLVIVTGSSGVLKVIHEAFHILGSRGKQRIWLELEDFPTIPVVGAEIFTSLAERTGALPLSYMRPLPRDIWARKKSSLSDQSKDEVVREKRISAWLRFFRESCEDLGLSAHNWVIGFYGRNGPGGCCGWSENQYWDSQTYLEFHDLLNGLTLAGFSVLYAPYDVDRSKRDQERSKYVMDFMMQSDDSQNFKYEIPPDENFEQIGIIKENQNNKTKTPNGDFYHKHKLNCPESDAQRFETILESVWREILEPSLCKEPPKAELSDIEWRRQVTALYATTLYRQSRHFSAFLNDAVFRCPARFNLHHFDNDANRVSKVEKWLGVLTRAGFFFIKPGGFAWAYRDTRLAFRYIVSQVSQSANYTANEKNDRLPIENNYPVIRDVMGFRARANFHIGEWYARAHRVTHHPMPLMEALHHFYQAAIYSCNAEEGKGVDDPNLPIYRLRLFFQALTAIHHSLRSGIESLRYWSSNPAIQYLCDNFIPPNSTLGENKAVKLREVLQNLICGIHSNTTGATSLKDNWEGLSKSGGDLINRIVREIESIKSKLQDRDPIIDLDSYIARSDDSKSEITQFSLDKLHPELDSVSDVWMGDVFEPVNEIVNCAINRLTKSHDASREVKLCMGEELWKDIGDLELKYFADNPQALYDPRIGHKKVQHLVEWSFVFIRRAKRLSRARDCKMETDKYMESSKQCYLIASVLGSVAMDFCRLLPVELEAFTTQQQIKALALYGLAQGHLGRFEEAHRRLSDARALIRSMKTEDRHVSLGITELRRAEVFCLQACECGAILSSVKKEKEEKWILNFDIFQHFISEDLTVRLSSISSNNLKPTNLTEIDKERVKNILRRYDLNFDSSNNNVTSSDSATLPQALSTISKVQQARVGDAWRCVEEARREFVGRTHSERWWGRLYTLEMRVFGEAGAAILNCRKLSDSCKAEHFRMLPFRSRRDVAHYLKKVWKKCIGVAGDGKEDIYERCRATLLYRFALSIHECSAVHSISDREMEMAKVEVWRFVEKIDNEKK